MHYLIRQCFQDHLHKLLNKSANSVLEIGTPKSQMESLLFIPSTIHMQRTGIDIGGPYMVGDVLVSKGDMKALQFGDEEFDLVLCNSVLEHEPKFWIGLTEMTRVLKKGGLLMLGVPGFDSTRETLQFHPYPDDYYRFSASAMQEVLLGDLEKKECFLIHKQNFPPRIIGYGYKST
jgi:SAM-dependent methyltransferase